MSPGYKYSRRQHEVFVPWANPPYWRLQGQLHYIWCFWKTGGCHLKTMVRFTILDVMKTTETNADLTPHVWSHMLSLLKPRHYVLYLSPKFQHVHGILWKVTSPSFTEYWHILFYQKSRQSSICYSMNRGRYETQHQWRATTLDYFALWLDFARFSLLSSPIGRSSLSKLGAHQHTLKFFTTPQQKALSRIYRGLLWI